LRGRERLHRYELPLFKGGKMPRRGGGGSTSRKERFRSDAKDITSLPVGGGEKRERECR